LRLDLTKTPSPWSAVHFHHGLLEFARRLGGARAMPSTTSKPRVRAQAAPRLDPADLEFLRLGIGATLADAGEAAQPAYVSTSADDDQALWTCTCVAGRRGKACRHVAPLQTMVDDCHARWGGRSWQPVFERSVWQRVAEVCFAADGRDCAGLRVQQVTLDGQAFYRVEASRDGALRALVPRDAAGQRLLERLGLGPLGAGEGSRARLLERLQRLQASPHERALNEHDTYTRRQASERSFYGRVAYHLVREQVGANCVPRVDRGSADFLLLCRTEDGSEALRLVLPRDAVASVLELLRAVAPHDDALAVRPLPLKTLFKVTASTALDVEVRPMIEALQAGGEARLFERAELERFRYGRLVYLPDLQVLAELEPPGPERRFTSPSRLTLTRSQVPAFVQDMQAQAELVVDGERRALHVFRAPDRLALADPTLDEGGHDFWADVRCGFGATEISLLELLRARDARLPYLEVGGGWVELSAPGLEPLWSLAPTREPRRRREHAVRLASRDVLQLAAASPEALGLPAGGAVAAKLARLLEGRTLEPLPTLTGLRSELRFYQRHGVDWLRFLHEHQLAGLLCDDMGLGKTHQVMAFLVWLRERRDVPGAFLVVCPTSVVSHWTDKLRAFAPGLAHSTYHGQQRALPATLAAGHVLVTTYGVLRNDVARLSDLRLSVAVFDEIQHVKNRSTASYEAATALTADMKIGLTGTPVENSLADLKALMDVVLPGYLGSDAQFGERHGTSAGPAGRAQLRRRLAPFLLRRLKQDVLHELPAKIDDLRTCGLSDAQRKLYQDVLAAKAAPLRAQLSRGDEPVPYLHVFAVLNLLKRICDHPALALGTPERYTEWASGKWELFTEILDEALAAGHKVVVFSQYLGMLDIMARHLTEQGVGHALLTGATVARGALLSRFNDDPECRVFLGSLKAGGVGIDLVAASVVVHYDRWWNAAREDQATDRVHRIGQQRAVQVFKLITRGTLEERIARIIEDKRALMGELVASDDPHLAKVFTREQLLELLAPA
jgi:superfamily II DNA or RNA helicase